MCEHTVVTAGNLCVSCGGRVDDTPMDFGPKARTSDPDTSHIAAEVVLATRANSQRAKLWHAFTSGKKMTDEEAMQVAGLSPTSEYATRCSELRNAGVLKLTGKTRPGSSGLPRVVSRITDFGLDKYAEMFS